MKNPINTLLDKVDDDIAEEDKALEEDLSKELNDAFAATLEKNWAGTGFSTADNEPDNPLPIDNPESKVFGAPDSYTLTLPAIDDTPSPFQDQTPSPKSPEDMEKEYISEAENTIKEFCQKDDEHLIKIKTLEDEIETLKADQVVFDRIISRAKASIKDVAEPTPPANKPKTPKKSEGK